MNELGDLVRLTARSLRQLAHLVGDDGEAVAVHSCAGSFNGRVEQLGAIFQTVDATHDVPPVFSAVGIDSTTLPLHAAFVLWCPARMLRLLVQAHPASRSERVELLEDGSLGVWVRARPVEGQANAAIVRAIADALDLRTSQVLLVAGTRGRRKIVDIDLPDAEAVHSRLLAHGVRSR